MSEPLPPPVTAVAPAGWYPDPTGAHAWRWWNGTAWTAFAAGPHPTVPARRPRLVRWLSLPVAIAAPIVLVAVGLLAVFVPLAVVAGLVPFAIVLPVLSWLDRVEPEPLASRVHAILWGASVAAIIAFVTNTTVAAVFGDIAAMVLSAPLVEEAAKGLGIVWAVRRREIDGVTDGIVFAGWVAIGFAVVEDMSYFAVASIDGTLVPVFVVRAVLTPFAHPLFTFWIGLAIGLAVRAGRAILPGALWGYAIAVATHMAWNGSLAFGEVTTEVDEDVAVTVVLLAMLLFVALFVSVAIALVSLRRREQRRFEQMWPFLVQQYGLGAEEAAMFTSWRRLVRARRRLPRAHRARFDEVWAALARLSMLHERMNEIDPATQRVLAQQLHDARRALRDGG